MTEDVFLLDIPEFKPKYDSGKKYGWTKYKNNLLKLLCDTTCGYCMYCYDAVLINGQMRGQIEHGVEKNIFSERLNDCVPNLGISCEICNGKYKRRGEANRKPSEKSVAELKKESCKYFSCTEACGSFEKLRLEYIKKGKLLLQPGTIVNDKTTNVLRLQYDLLQAKYIPMKAPYTYDQDEIKIIEEHIKLFGLNTPERRNYEIGRYCRNVIDYKSTMPGIKYNNMLVDLFREKLQKLQIERAIKVCEIVYQNALLRLST